jgi:hypothetical protein
VNCSSFGGGGAGTSGPARVANRHVSMTVIPVLDLFRVTKFEVFAQLETPCNNFLFEVVFKSVC